MRIVIIIFVSIIVYFLISILISNLADTWITRKMAKLSLAKGRGNFYRRNSSAKEYRGEEHGWDFTFHLEHRGLKVFNIPFVPEENEIFYMENEYDEDANLFIQENMELIRDKLASVGLTFVYLPSIHVTKDMAESMVAYYTANPHAKIDDSNLMQGLKSSFLLDYMVYPENRPKITRGFCWYNSTIPLFNFKKKWYVFDYIAFDGAEARKNPVEILEEMLPELGTMRIWRNGLHCEVEIESDGLADDNFDEETKNILSDIQEKLNSVRLKGISEAIISRYVKPYPKLSRLTISNDFKITLNDYNETEIIMEPIVKSVFILFLRHEEGIYFKDLHDYQNELEIIYRSVKAKRNDINTIMESGITPQISNNVKSLTNPLSNSINEKCTRIKEAFIQHYHDCISSNYYIQGTRAAKKVITIPRNLVIWEELS